ncbi:macrophage mannose receptor 1-like [Centroberyx affinis]|uniref:macrophage mannose receptor 1-like n=1 Tax=Centroberyx affinis TaxID=166261 RepID=UPI003A5C5AE5
MKEILLSILAVSGLCAVSSYRQYHFVYEPKNVIEARRHCREKYTDLATLDNMEDVKRLNDIVDLQKLSSFNDENLAWIGLQDDVNSWRWSLADRSFYEDGEAEFRNWHTGEPNNQDSGECCVVMYAEGTWNDEPCINLNLPICFDAEEPTERFLLINKSMTWTEAQSYCRQHHTDLASVRNPTENQKIQELMPAGLVGAWIGLSRDSWKWLDGSKSSFRNWNTVEPNNERKNGACVAAKFSSGKWEDWNCDVTRTFICYSSVMMKQVVRVKLKKTDSSLDLNDPAVMEAILKQFKQRLKDNGVTEDVKISWRQQSDGKVFHREEEKKKKSKKTIMPKEDL